MGWEEKKEDDDNGEMGKVYQFGIGGLSSLCSMSRPSEKEMCLICQVRRGRASGSCIQAIQAARISAYQD